MTGLPFDGCTHTPPHLHGENRTYRTHACRCEECTTVHRRVAMRWRKSRALGSAATVDAQPAREHVARLRSSGLTMQDVADRAGIARRSLTVLMHGNPGKGRPRPARIRRVTSDALLAIPLPRTSRDVTPTRIIAATGTARRLQALQARGWSLNTLAPLVGRHWSTLHKVREDGRVTVGTAHDVAAAFERLWDVPPPSATPHQRAAITYALTRARKYRWVPPAAWDEGTIDRPSARPYRADADRRAG